MIDLGATCHMCNDEYFFMDYESLKIPVKVKLGNGFEVDAIGSGVVMLIEVSITQLNK